MRIYANLADAFRETERDLWEMGIKVHPATMQDKFVGDNDDYSTRELQGYAFKLTDIPRLDREAISDAMAILLNHLEPEHFTHAVNYVLAEIKDRTGAVPMNPGNAYKERPEVWDEFLHGGKFHYTYSERFVPQLGMIVNELQTRPDTRQAIMAMHQGPREEQAMGGKGRVPCSMYYQFLLREGKLHIIYTMRSCDLLTHFPIDVILARLMQEYVADQIGADMGDTTYFAGSLHAYQKDITARKVF